MDFAHFGAYKVILEILNLNRPFRIFCSRTILELFWNNCSGFSYILQMFNKNNFVFCFQLHILELFQTNSSSVLDQLL